jgi:hypothetical protein
MRRALTVLAAALIALAGGSTYLLGAGDPPVRHGDPPARTTDATGCVRTGQVVAVGLSSTRHARILAHAREAIADGWPEVLVVHRAGADARRDRLLSGTPTAPGMDRDEYPPAMARSGWRADVAYVPASENRSAGSVMGIKLRRYCDGTRFRYVGY